MSADEKVPHTRRGDPDLTWVSVGLAWLQRLSPIFVILLALFFAIGFRFESPAAWFASVEGRMSQQDSTMRSIDARVTNIEAARAADMQSIDAKLDALIRFRCQEFTPQQRATYPFCD